MIVIIATIAIAFLCFGLYAANAGFVFHENNDDNTVDGDISVEKAVLVLGQQQYSPYENQAMVVGFDGKLSISN